MLVWVILHLQLTVTNQQILVYLVYAVNLDFRNFGFSNFLYAVDCD